MNVFELCAKIALDTSSYKESLTESRGELYDFATSVEEKFSSINLGALLGLGKKVWTLGKDAVETGARFDSAMSRVQAISGVTEEEFETLRESALEMGKETKFTAEESAEALYYMAMAGWKTDQMLSGLPGVLNLAAASGEGLGTTADIVTDALTAFGLTADDTDRFVNVLAATAANANTDIFRMGETFKYVASTAGGAAKYSVEDVAVAIGLMANAGVKGSMAGTSLRNTIVNLADPSKNAAAVIEKYGISVSDASGKMLPFMDVLTQLRAAFSGSGEGTEKFREEIAVLNDQFEAGLVNEDEYAEQSQEIAARLFGDVTKIADAADIAGKYGMAGFLSMVTASDEEFEKLVSAINNSDGAAEEMAEIMQDNLLGSITKFESAVDNIKISFSSIIAPSVKSIVDDFTYLVNTLSLDKYAEDIAKAFENISTTVSNIVERLREVAVLLGGHNTQENIDAISSATITSEFYEQNGGEAPLIGFGGILQYILSPSYSGESGKFANGSSYIPEDGWNYLHHGERVLTAEENREYTGPNSRAKAFVSTANINIVLDGNVIGRTAYTWIETYNRAIGG